MIITRTEVSLFHAQKLCQLLESQGLLHRIFGPIVGGMTDIIVLVNVDDHALINDCMCYKTLMYHTHNIFS